MICLDSNVVIGVINRRRPDLAARFDAELEYGTSIFLPAIVLFELRYGVAKSRWPEKNAAALQKLLGAPIRIVSFDEQDAGEAAEIRAQLERTGLPIGPYDNLIAAQARRRGAVLVTANRREFERVPGLMVQDWTN